LLLGCSVAFCVTLGCALVVVVVTLRYSCSDVVVVVTVVVVAFVTVVAVTFSFDSRLFYVRSGVVVTFGCYVALLLLRCCNVVPRYRCYALPLRWRLLYI